MAIDRRTKAIIRDLEIRLQERDRENAALRAQLEGQGIEVQEMARAGMELRAEETADLALYQGRIAELTTLVEEVAMSKSKFARPARDLLGISSDS